jgi:hypothetical protein
VAYYFNITENLIIFQRKEQRYRYIHERQNSYVNCLYLYYYRSDWGSHHPSIVCLQLNVELLLSQRKSFCKGAERIITSVIESFDNFNPRNNDVV